MSRTGRSLSRRVRDRSRPGVAQRTRPRGVRDPADHDARRPRGRGRRRPAGCRRGRPRSCAPAAADARARRPAWRRAVADPRDAAPLGVRSTSHEPVARSPRPGAAGRVPRTPRCRPGSPSLPLTGPTTTRTCRRRRPRPPWSAVEVDADRAQTEVLGAERPADRVRARRRRPDDEQPVAQPVEQRARLEAGRVVLGAAVDAVGADTARAAAPARRRSDPDGLDPRLLAQGPRELGHHQLDRLLRELARVAREGDVGDARRRRSAPTGDRRARAARRSGPPGPGPRSARAAAPGSREVASCSPPRHEHRLGHEDLGGRVEEVERDLLVAAGRTTSRARSARRAPRRCATRRPRRPSGSRRSRCDVGSGALPGARASRWSASVSVTETPAAVSARPAGSRRR